MAIESTRIAAGPTVARKDARVACVDIWSSPPGGGTLASKWDRESSSWQDTVDNGPFLNGQIIAVITTSNDIVELYSWDSSGYSWKRVSIISSTVDPRTGDNWDPNAGFYNPLAS